MFVYVHGVKKVIARTGTLASKIGKYRKTQCKKTVKIVRLPFKFYIKDIQSSPKSVQKTLKFS